MFEVNCWTSHPDKGNGDCQSHEFPTKEEALSFKPDNSVKYVEIIGAKFYQIDKNPNYKK